MRHRKKYGKVTLLYGARTPSELMYTSEYDRWRQAQIDIEITDRARGLDGPRGSRADVVLSVPHRSTQDGGVDMRP
jgi:NAD(P)H-flavin reductase